MLRRSERLRNNGYYDINGQPVISYKDTPSRWRRRTSRLVNGEVTSRERFRSQEEEDMIDQKKQMMDTLMRCCYVFRVAFGVFVAFALICRIISLHSRPSEFGVEPTLTETVTISGSKDQEYLSKLLLMESKLDSLQPQADLWPNFALESQGALILYKRTSKSYENHRASQMLGVPVRLPPVGPNIVIKGRTRMYPGQCWAFADFPGRLSIALSHKATITHVSLGHISKSISPTSSISSAPREFSVYGKKNLEDEESHLGTFIYDDNGDQLQTFKLPADNVGTFTHVTLKVNSNWGNPEYTCLYNFRVHGVLGK